MRDDDAEYRPAAEGNVHQLEPAAHRGDDVPAHREPYAVAALRPALIEVMIDPVSYPTTPVTGRS